MKYGSRKFIITSLVVVVTTAMAYLSKLDANTALVYAAAITSYNVVNGWVEKKNAQ